MAGGERRRAGEGGGGRRRAGWGKLGITTIWLPQPSLAGTWAELGNVSFILGHFKVISRGTFIHLQGSRFRSK